MPIYLEISRLHRCVTIVARGKIAPDEIMGAAQQLFDANVPEFAKIVDLLDASGEFYFEDLPPGDHPGVASWGGRTCRATIHMPDKAPPMTEAGVVRCVEEER